MFYLNNLFKKGLQVVLLVLIANSVNCKLLRDESPNENHRNYPYCFKFTWIGPRYNGESKIQNMTCDDLLKGTKGYPCRRPLVATNNSDIPDTDWIWDQYKNKPTEIMCRLSKGEVCVKYAFLYNGAVENITYMCSKVYIESEKAVTSGCYSQYEHGREIQVCACESSSGEKPCNKSVSIRINYTLLWKLVSIIFIFSNFFINGDKNR